MALNPPEAKLLAGEVVAVEGRCGAGHKVGDKLNLSCWDSGGLCGFFYHDIFWYLSALQFGGEIPWAEDGKLSLECPDKKNLVTLVLRQS